MIASEEAYAATKLAALSGSLPKLREDEARFGLTVTSTGKYTPFSFDNCNRYFETRKGKAIMPCFYGHAIALFRESDTHFGFYGANAGSYRVDASKLRQFLTNYNDVCLPKKWPATAKREAYNLPVTQPFDEIFEVSKP